MEVMPWWQMRSTDAATRSIDYSPNLTPFWADVVQDEIDVLTGVRFNTWGQCGLIG